MLYRRNIRQFGEIMLSTAIIMKRKIQPDIKVVSHLYVYVRTSTL